VLRRFELYGVARAPADDAVRALATACRRCGEFIPEVSHSRVGWNLSAAPVQLVWEHAFASPEAYQRYMIHPFHAAVLDRYLLPDSPERVVSDNDLGAGLVGYECDGPVFAMRKGVRRLVLLRVDRRAGAGQLHRMQAALRDVPAADDQMILSVVGANTLGAAWFDAVTAVGRRPRFTHLWEQGFVDRDALAGYRHGGSVVAEAERRQWDGWMDGIIEQAVDIHYDLDS
jgi:hypothetical protein